MRTNYVLIDFENVRPKSLAGLSKDHFKVFVFVGERQANVPIELAESLQRLGPSAEYIKISGSGRNALDFHITYYIGRISAEDPSAYFHIISKDKGFDALVKHLKSQKIYAARAESIDKIPLVNSATAVSRDERIKVIVSKLLKLKAAKPRRLKTLASTIASLFQKKLSENEITSLLKELKIRGHVFVEDNKVSYELTQVE